MTEKYSDEDMENDISNLLSDGEEARVSDEGTPEEDESEEDDAILVRKVFHQVLNKSLKILVILILLQSFSHWDGSKVN